MANPYITQITAYGCNYAIRDWALCQGQSLTIVQYQAVYALLGTNFGGDGRTTFGLPDLRGRAPLGMGVLPGGSLYQLGARYGFESVYIAPTNLPVYSVPVAGTGTTSPVTTTVAASSGGPDTNDPGGAYQATFPPGNPVFAASLTPPVKDFASVDIPAQNVAVTGQTGPLGSGTQLENRSPYQVLNWQISLDGVWPPRN